MHWYMYRRHSCCRCCYHHHHHHHHHDIINYYPLFNNAGEMFLFFFQINNLRTQVRSTEDENARLIKEGK